MSEAGDPRPSRAARVAAVLEVRFRNAGQFLVSYCTNLSRGGLFVTTANPAPVGTVLTLSVGVPGLRTPAQLTARVRWIRAAPDATGPAGMGLSFEQVDEVLGGVIDGIVSHAAPLRIEMVGHPDRAWRHVAALVRALVTCETKERNLEPGVDAQLAGADLVLVDVDRSAAVALALLERLAQMSNPPPVLALCAGNNPQLRAQAGRFATVVSVPVDSDTMQAAVLTALGQVAAAADG